MSSKVKLFSMLGGKMGFCSEGVIRKAVELHRLLQLKVQSSPISISETCQIVLCLDLAASSLGIPFEKVDAIKLSGVPKRNYTNFLNTVSKLLGKENNITIKDLCVQFGVSEASSLAQKILETHKSTEPSGRAADFDHPMYCVAAVLAACKKQKLKVDRAKLMEKSSIQRSTFFKLLSSFEKWAEELAPAASRKKKKILEDEDLDRPSKMLKEELKPEPSEKLDEYMSYEEWKKKILEECAAED